MTELKYDKRIKVGMYIYLGKNLSNATNYIGQRCLRICQYPYIHNDTIRIRYGNMIIDEMDESKHDHFPLTYPEPERSSYLSNILDLSKEPDKENLIKLLNSPDEDSRNLALEICRNKNCIVI